MGKSLSAWLKFNKMTQAELARLVGVSRMSINFWASGRRSMNIHHALKIKKITGLSVERLEK